MHSQRTHVRGMAYQMALVSSYQLHWSLQVFRKLLTNANQKIQHPLTKVCFPTWNSSNTIPAQTDTDITAKTVISVLGSA